MLKNILSSPKTTMLAVLTLACGVVSIWAPPQYREKIHDTAIVIAGSSLFISKDPNQ